MLNLVTSDQVKPVGLGRGLGVDVSEALPDIDRSYAELRPLFFGALGKLARQGFATPPTDGLDLIHDFFADEWINLRRTYDPAKGSYRAYAYRAFVQFVRPRIVRMQRLQNYKVRPEEAESAISELYAATPSLETSHDSEVLRKKIAALPELQRRILQEYVYAENVSERALATTFSLSRYKLRELLVDALGRVLVSLDKPARISDEDWQVALALWKDARSIYETAKYLGMSEHQVRIANKRNFSFLTSVLNIYQPHRGGSFRRLEMKATTGAMLEPRVLFKQAVFSPGNEMLLKEIEDRAVEVAASLDAPDAIDIPDSVLRNIDPLWIARLYEALAKADESEEQLAAPELFYAHADAEHEIGRAYKESLIPGLPPYLADLAGWLVRVPEVEEDEMADILRSPAAVGAQPLSVGLARYGVTALTVLEATDAISRLVERCRRTGRLSTTEPVRLSHTGLGEGDFINGELLAKEISLVSVCREPTAHVLLEWSVGVAQFKQYLFSGFVAEPERGNAVLLVPTEGKMNDLHQRWGLSRVLEAVAT